MDLGTVGTIVGIVAGTMTAIAAGFNIRRNMSAEARRGFLSILKVMGWSVLAVGAATALFWFGTIVGNGSNDPDKGEGRTPSSSPSETASPVSYGGFVIGACVKNAPSGDNVWTISDCAESDAYKIYAIVGTAVSCPHTGGITASDTAHTVKWCADRVGQG